MLQNHTNEQPQFHLSIIILKKERNKGRKKMKDRRNEERTKQEKRKIKQQQ